MRIRIPNIDDDSNDSDAVHIVDGAESNWFLQIEKGSHTYRLDEQAQQVLADMLAARGVRSTGPGGVRDHIPVREVVTAETACGRGWAALNDSSGHVLTHICMRRGAPGHVEHVCACGATDGQ